jgi:hypothetical protein
MKKSAGKLTPQSERARQKLKALTSRKTFSSLDTKFGVLTVTEPAEKRATRRFRGKPKR